MQRQDFRRVYSNRFLSCSKVLRRFFHPGTAPVVQNRDECFRYVGTKSMHRCISLQEVPGPGEWVLEYRRVGLPVRQAGIL
jgi:hypothetical protein